jgi:hypothetical protein
MRKADPEGTRKAGTPEGLRHRSVPASLDRVFRSAAALGAVITRPSGAVCAVREPPMGGLSAPRDRLGGDLGERRAPGVSAPGVLSAQRSRRATPPADGRAPRTGSGPNTTSGGGPPGGPYRPEAATGTRRRGSQVASSVRRSAGDNTHPGASTRRLSFASTTRTKFPAWRRAVGLGRQFVRRGRREVHGPCHASSRLPPEGGRFPRISGSRERPVSPPLPHRGNPSAAINDTDHSAPAPRLIRRSREASVPLQGD